MTLFISYRAIWSTGRLSTFQSRPTARERERGESREGNEDLEDCKETEGGEERQNETLRESKEDFWLLRPVSNQKLVGGLTHVGATTKKSAEPSTEMLRDTQI